MRIYYKLSLDITADHILTTPQCAIPCFEGLFPAKLNSITLDLLFDLAAFHALAKLRIHHDLSLQMLSAVTRRLGDSLRKFKSQMCDKPDLGYTPEELAKRARRHAKEDEKRAKQGLPPAQRRGQNGPKPFSLSTSKIHKLSHYEYMIRRFGTTDGYTTQNVSFPLFLHSFA